MGHLGSQQIISRLAPGPSPWFFHSNTSLQPASKVKNPVFKSRSASETEPENETIALVSQQPAPPSGSSAGPGTIALLSFRRRRRFAQHRSQGCRQSSDRKTGHIPNHRQPVRSPSHHRPKSESEKQNAPQRRKNQRPLPSHNLSRFPRLSRKPADNAANHRRN